MKEDVQKRWSGGSRADFFRGQGKWIKGGEGAPIRTDDPRDTRVTMVEDPLIRLYIHRDGETRILVVTVRRVDLGQWGREGGDVCMHTRKQVECREEGLQPLLGYP